MNKSPYLRGGFIGAAIIMGLLICPLCLLRAAPGLILQDQGPSASVFAPPQVEFLGQSFTAEDPLLLSIGIGVIVLNPGSVGTGISMSLFAGAGDAGSLLGARSIDPGDGGPRNTVHWVDFDFSGLVLIPGNVYTFTYTAQSTYWGGQYNQHSFPNGQPFHGGDYPGGHFFTEAGFSTLSDARFRVVSVPEPGVHWMLLAAGLVFCGRAWVRKVRR